MAFETITIPTTALDYEAVKNNLATEKNCTHPAGHCFGSDGGSGIPENLKVEINRGGQFEVWELSVNKKQLLKKMVFNRCQYCLKYQFNYEEETI